MHSPRSQSIAEQPWLCDYLAEKGFRCTAAGTFSNGRATLKIEGTVLRAIPSEAAKVWRSDLQGARPDSIRQLLDILLAGPTFQSQAELDRRAALQTVAQQALDQIADIIRQSPESESGRHFRKFLWSLFNQHHVINLWTLKDVLDSRGNSWVTEVFTAWMQGCVSEEVLRRALTDSGEMERWDTFSFQRRDTDHLADALKAVTGLLKTIPPSAPVVPLNRASHLLEEVRDCLRLANPDRVGEGRPGGGNDLYSGGGGVSGASRGS